MITIWLTGLFIHYCISKKFGEAISWATLIQVFGFIILTLGFFIYAGVIKLPSMFEKAKAEEATVPILKEEDDDAEDKSMEKKD